MPMGNTVPKEEKILVNTMLGAQLKKYRRAKGLTQQNVADQLHIRRQTYSNYERDVRTPDAKMLAALAALYDISINDLLCADTLKDAGSARFYYEGILSSSNSRLYLTGSEAKLVTDYRSLPEHLKENQLRYMKFLKSEAEEGR